MAHDRATFLSGFLVYVFVLAAPAMSAERHLFGWDAEPLTEPIIADRPGFSTSPQTVPRGRLQIEGGYQFTADRGIDSHGAPFLLIRAGLARNLELRLNWDGLSWTENNGHFKPEASDMSVELKAHLMEQRDFCRLSDYSGPYRFPPGAALRRPTAWIPPVDYSGNTNSPRVPEFSEPC